MRKIMLALALIVMGGVSLSTAFAAPAQPAVNSITAVAQADNTVQLVGGWKHWKHKHYGYKYGGYSYGSYGKKFKYYPKGYYKGFCYDKPYHWWCKKYFFKKYDDDDDDYDY